MGATVPAQVFRRLRKHCRGCHLAAHYYLIPSLTSRSQAIPDALKPLFIAVLYARTTDRVRFLSSYFSRGWRAGHVGRGRVQAWLMAARHVRRIGAWAGRGVLARARAKVGGKPVNSNGAGRALMSRRYGS
jgi:hypothetical protein